MCVLVAQLCLTLCECMDCSPPGPSVHGILQWVVIPFSRGLPYPGIKARSSVSQADSLPSELSEKLHPPPFVNLFITLDIRL